MSVYGYRGARDASTESYADSVPVSATDVIVTLPAKGTRDATATFATPASDGRRSPSARRSVATRSGVYAVPLGYSMVTRDRKSTRLNSSHEWISYAVFCLKKKKRDMALITQGN